MEGLVVIWLIFGAISGAVANARGLNWGTYFVLGILFGPIGLLAACLMRPTGTNVRAGDIVKLVHSVDLKGGAKLEKGHTSKVYEMDVIDGQAVVSIDGPGRRVWVAKRSVKMA